MPGTLIPSLSLSLVRDVRVSAYKYCVSHEERNKRTNRIRPRRDTAGGGGGTRRTAPLAADNCDRQGRERRERMPRRFVKGDMTYLITRAER